MIMVRFMSGSGPLRELKRSSFRRIDDAVAACRDTYGPQGFSNFAFRDERESDGGRITATTPGGRGLASPEFATAMSDVTVRGQLPLHTIVVAAFTRDGLYATKRAEICR